MSLTKQELKLRVDARSTSSRPSWGPWRPTGTAEAQKRKEQLEASLTDAQAHIKDGWEKITDQASSKLNEWLKGG